MKSRFNTLILAFILCILFTSPLLAQNNTNNGRPVTGEYIVRFADHVTDPAAAADRLGARFNATLEHVYTHAIYGCALSGLSAEQATALARHPDIARVEENSLFVARGAGSQGEAPWGLDRIDQRLQPLNGVYSYDYMGSGATVYVLDSGVRESHADFGGRASTGIDCTGRGKEDNLGHGTAVASLAAGTTYGVAKDARIISVKVLDASGTSKLSQVLCGLDYVVSLGGPAAATLALTGEYSESFDEALTKVIEARVFVALASGPEGKSCTAPVAGALTAAATDAEDRAAFVGDPNCVDLFAPGVAVSAAWNTSDTATNTVSGSSMAAAHVAGAAAVWLEAEPDLAPADLAADLLARATENRVIDPQGAPDLLLAKLPEQPVVVESIAPEVARVGQPVVLTGRGFGDFQASSSRVFFTDGQTTWTAAVPRVWRDDRIEVNVPVGDTFEREPRPLPVGEIFVQVQTNGQLSAAVLLQLATLGGGGGGPLAFSELTQISSDMDISTTLASPDHNSDPLQNKARTKDADIADVDGDGFDDIFDSNSNNSSNNTHAILRLNNQNQTFSAMWMEPLDVGDTVGPFASSTHPLFGNFPGNAVSYDADLVDIDNDTYPDLLQTSTQGLNNFIRVLMNNIPSPGQFFEGSTRVPALSTVGCPDDIAHGDLNCDGWQDFAVTHRRAGACTIQSGDRSATSVFLNIGTGNPGNFGLLTSLQAPAAGNSAHDVFFADFNDDMALDIVVVNEGGAVSQLFMHNGSFASPVFTQTLTFSNFGGFAGDPGDFNGDGEMDFVLAGNNKISVFLNNATPVPSFTEVALPGPVSPLFYDADIGDIDCDGDLDIVAGAITTIADSAVRVWTNDGSGTFTNVTAGGASTLLPGIGPYQRLSVDLIDIDNDGDLDLYITGADGQDVAPGPGFGRVPNQLFENLVH